MYCAGVERLLALARRLTLSHSQRSDVYSPCGYNKVSNLQGEVTWRILWYTKEKGSENKDLPTWEFSKILTLDHVFFFLRCDPEHPNVSISGNKNSVKMSIVLWCFLLFYIYVLFYF